MNIFAINILIFYKNPRFRPQGPFMFISDNFEVVKSKVFLFVSKQIGNFFSLSKGWRRETITRPFVFISDFFKGVKNYFFSLYIKTNGEFLPSIYSSIKIEKNIFGINILFFYVNQRFKPQGGIVLFCCYFIKFLRQFSSNSHADTNRINRTANCEYI